MNAEIRELVEPTHSAVLVIDVQNDACHPDGLYARNGMDISLRQRAAHKTAEFIKEARKHEVPIIFVRSGHSKWTDSPAWLRRRRRGGPQPFMEGTWGAEFYAAEPLPGEAIVSKHRYSAFMGTDLDMILQSNGVTTLIVTGGGTNACVESTVRTAVDHDYDIVVVSDCCGTPNLKEHEPSLKRMASSYGTVAEASEVLEALKSWR